MNDHLSVVIPAYNLENNIEKTMLSVLKQSFPVSNVIIINDGSNDRTGHLINDFINYHELTNWQAIHQKNMGVSCARNIGIKHTTGEYILFLDGDDTISNNLSAEIKSRQQSGCDILFWPHENFNKNCNPIYSNTELIHQIYLERKIWVWIGAVAYRRENILQNNIEFTPNCINGEDQEFFIKALAHSKKCLYLNNVKSFYFKRENSISNTFEIKKFDSIFSISRGIKYFFEKNEGSSQLVMSHAIYYEYHNFFKNNLNILFSQKITPRKAILTIKNSLSDNYTKNELDNIKIKMASNSLKKKIRSLLLDNFPTLYSYYTYLKSCRV